MAESRPDPRRQNLCPDRHRLDRIVFPLFKRSTAWYSFFHKTYKMKVIGTAVIESNIRFHAVLRMIGRLSVKYDTVS